MEDCEGNLRPKVYKNGVLEIIRKQVLMERDEVVLF